MKVTKWVDMGAEVQVEISIEDIDGVLNNRAAFAPGNPPCLRQTALPAPE